MPKPIHITAPRPTQEEIETLFPISKASEKAIKAHVEEFKAKLSNQEEATATSIEPEKRRKRASAA
jgi:hypothetical protein